MSRLGEGGQLTIFALRHAFLLSLLMPAAGLFAEQSPKRPNVLVFITDDQGWRDSAAYGSPYVRTPSFDRLAREGVLFEHAYVSAPSCTPSRAAMLTGRNFWELGTGAILHGALPQEFVTYPDLMESQGYAVGYTGKAWGPGRPEDSGRSRNPAGPAFNQVSRDPKPPVEFSSNDYAANFREFLKTRAAGQPFCFWVGATEPHHPHNSENHKNLPFDYRSIELPPFLPPADGCRLERANYFGEVEYADQRLGEVLSALEEAGELENTLVLVTGDNGTPLPRAKSNMYDWGMRVPLAVRWPAKVKPGRKVQDMVSLRDCAATFLEAAGIAVPASMSARSFLDVLLSEQSGLVDASRTWVAGGLEWHDRAYPTRMIRTPDFLYIRNYSSDAKTPRNERSLLPDSELPQSSKTLGIHALISRHADHPTIKPYWELCFGPRPSEELYDCGKDPWQMKNLATAEGYEEIKKELSKRLDVYLKETGDPRSTGHVEVLEEAIRRVEEARKAADAKKAAAAKRKR